MVIPKTLVFHDCKQEASNAAIYNNNWLPVAMKNQGVIKHYHSNMSAKYLQQTYDDFSSDAGTCRILHATAGASTGLDICGICIVIQYGMCKNMAKMLHLTGLFLIMAEPWAFSTSLDEKPFDCMDPDKPYTGTVKKSSSKQEWTGCAVLHLIQSTTCL
ncbi:hypothetical protein PAXRUDRAFT_801399 [Paxillus rubicundulus Ve08.2h10]|uniref:Helicase C-terminal domain-containing protein n=1 Tax=Paxillus rubicundulus Ve08.2h10 TaxID=930991 RepID=A0A0D0E1N4_9AGAM|nr:hypothetical protein PAXRUDRAFT_801399 [Paxillus rubicundulus Ve08.2h10]